MKRILLTLFAAAISISSIYAQQNLKDNFNQKRGLAIEGYDPVSYFDSGPKQGNKEFSVTHQGVTYLFSSQKNLDKFKSNPGRYVPAYGGWCAYAMGLSGDKVKIDPETYKITDGKLYLFYNFGKNNTLIDWNKDESNLQKKADQFWQDIIDQ